MSDNNNSQVWELAMVLVIVLVIINCIWRALQ